MTKFVAAVFVKHSKEVVLLTDCEVQPEAAWLAIQRQRPLAQGRWYRAFPVTGGSMLVQEGTYTKVCDVQPDLVNSVLDGNPARNTILEIAQASGCI